MTTGDTPQSSIRRTLLDCGHTRDGICRGVLWCEECQDFVRTATRAGSTDG